MKKIAFKIAAFAVIVAVTASCGSSKQVAGNTTNSNSAKIQQMKEEADLIEAQRKLDEAKAASDRAAKQREADAAVAAANAQAQAQRLAAARRGTERNVGAKNFLPLQRANNRQ